MSDRCYACCQENCGNSRCYCSCHGRPSPKETDCPKGIHVAELYRYSPGSPTEYWCMHCGAKTDDDGNPILINPPEPTKAVETYNTSVYTSPCKKHRTYKAIRKPTSGCEECWRFYIKNHP